VENRPEKLDSGALLWHERAVESPLEKDRSVTERGMRLVVDEREDKVSWDEGAQALSAHAGWNELRRELDRSRRFGHEFVLIRMERIHRNRQGTVDLVRKLPARLRSSDSVWGVHRQAFVLLPEAHRDVGVALIARLRRESPALLPPDVRLASFPADGSTRGALLDLLDKPGRPVDDPPPGVVAAAS
jgi:hypothetical protein